MLEIDELLGLNRKSSRRESTSSIDDHSQSLTKSGRKKRSSSLIHSLAEKLSEKENSPPISLSSSRRRLTSTRLSERDEENHSPPISAKSTARNRAQSVSGSIRHHSKEDSPPNSHRRRSNASKRDERSRHSSPPSPKMSSRKSARSMSGTSIKHSPKDGNETMKAETNQTHSLTASRRNSAITKLHEQERFSSPPNSPKISARKRAQSVSGASVKSLSKDHNKTSILKSGPSSAKGSKESLFRKEDRNADSDDDIVVSPDSNKSRSMSIGAKSLDENKPRKTSKTLFKRPMSQFDLSDSMALRSSAYQDWVQRKLQENKRKRAVSAKQLKEQEEKHKVKETRKIDALATYESWKRQKDEKIMQKMKRDKRKEEKKLHDEKMAKEEKARDAEKLFHVWKNEKEKVLRDVHREKLRKKEEEKEKEDEKRQKRKEADMVFSRWKENKDKEIHNVVHAIKTIQQERNDVIETMQSEKDLKAVEAYEVWLRKKEIERIEKLNDSFNQPYSELEPKIPWLPPNKTTLSSKPTRMTKIRR